MKEFGYGAIGLLAVTVFTMLFFAIKSGKPFRLLLLNAAVGILLLTAIDCTTVYTGIHLPINTWTAAGTAVFGAPAVVGFLLLQIIFL